MNIEIRTTDWKEVNRVLQVTGVTVINTDDYTELKGKTVDEIKHMDLKTLLELETNDGGCLVNTMEYEIGRNWDYELDMNDLDTVFETEIREEL
jgi:hypothetical protein